MPDDRVAIDLDHGFSHPDRFFAEPGLQSTGQNNALHKIVPSLKTKSVTNPLVCSLAPTRLCSSNTQVQ